MNMAFIGILFFCFVVIRAQTEAKTFVNVECKTGNVGQYGQQSMLDCVVQTTQDVKEAKILVVTWKKEGSETPLLVFNRRKTVTLPGYKFAEPNWNDENMNISLLITNTMVADGGDYTCMVMTDSGDSSQSTNLIVTAKYNKPTISSIPEKITRNENVILLCSSFGGYPEGQLRWFDEHNKEWAGRLEVEAEKTNNGLFQLSSKLSLLKSSIFSKYTCVVFNASGGKEDEVTLMVSDKAPEGQEGGTFLAPASKIVAPVVVIGSLIVGLLLVLLVYRRRSQQARRFSATPLMSDHRELSTCESKVELGDHRKM